MTINQIITTIAACYKITPGVLYSRKRDKKTVEVRQMAIYLCRKLTGETLENIGFEFKRDHATVMFYCNQVEKKMAENGEFKSRVEGLIMKFADKTNYYSTPQYSFILIN